MVYLQEFYVTGLNRSKMQAALIRAGFQEDHHSIPGSVAYIANHTFATAQSMGNNGSTEDGLMMDLDVPPTELSPNHPVKVLFSNISGIEPKSLIPEGLPKHPIADYLN